MAGPPGTPPPEIGLKGSGRDPEQARAALGSWLAPRLGASGAVRVSPLSSPPGTGVANETLLLDAAWDGRHGEREAGFAVRVASRVPLYLDADIEVHYRMYEALADVPGVPVPRVLGFEPDPAWLGAPFFVMERIRGDVPGDNPHWTAGGFVADATPGQRRCLWTSAVRALASLHQVEASRLPFLRPPEGMSGLAHHLAYWRRYLDWVCQGAGHDVLYAGLEYLEASRPSPEPTALSWGDARISNMMFRDFEVAAVFDWDTVSLAGPEADLAWWLSMDGEACRGFDGMGTPEELIGTWQSLTGRTAGALGYWMIFSAFRLGAIVMNVFRQMAARGEITLARARELGDDNFQVRRLAGLLADH